MVQIAEHFVQRPAPNALHGEVLVAVGSYAEIVDRHDRGVLELALDLRLEEESRAELLVPGDLRANDLHRDRAPDARVFAERDLPMPPWPSESPGV